MTDPPWHGEAWPGRGVVPGAIQLTPSGQPLVLMPDAGTTGGYPVIAVVVEADLAALGQLVPGADLAFTQIGLEAARRAAIDMARLVGRKVERPAV